MKTTLATIKKFIRQSGSDLMIRTQYKFDGMTDGLVHCSDQSHVKITACTRENSLGIAGAWFVLRGGDYFSTVDTPDFQGFNINNCVGSFDLVVRKGS